MLLSGDEFCRTQAGNNNAYCQDNEISWVDWNRLEQHSDIYHFTQGMIAFRAAHPVLSKEQFYTEADILWLAPAGGFPNWSDTQVKALACIIFEDKQNKKKLLLMVC